MYTDEFWSVTPEEEEINGHQIHRSTHQRTASQKREAGKKACSKKAD